MNRASLETPMNCCYVMFPNTDNNDHYTIQIYFYSLLEEIEVL